MTTSADRTGEQPAGHARGGDRRHRYPGRNCQVFVRLSDDEYTTLAAAAARVELTTTGYVAEAALAAARDQETPGSPMDQAGIARVELAQLQRELFAARTALGRIGSNLNQAVTTLHRLGRPPAWLHETVIACRRVVERVDAVVTKVDGRLW
jgi:hypothetical protein